MIPIQDNIPCRNPPLVTWGLILVNALVFLYELSLPERVLKDFFYNFGMVPAWMGLHWDDYLTFLTSMFLHGGWTHILGNMWCLYLFGDNVEDRMGHGRFLGFYLLCGLGAGLTHYLTNLNSPVPTLGASGAIAGVMGAYLVLFPTARVFTLIPILFIPFFVDIPAVVFLGTWFLSQFLNGTLALATPGSYEGVAWWAHVGGFAVGIVLLPLFKKSEREYGRRYRDEYRAW
jgi:membrane associated rhomboid family serine protease